MSSALFYFSDLTMNRILRRVRSIDFELENLSPLFPFLSTFLSKTLL
jgi:hypothetical protein